MGHPKQGKKGRGFTTHFCQKKKKVVQSKMTVEGTLREWGDRRSKPIKLGFKFQKKELFHKKSLRERGI